VVSIQSFTQSELNRKRSLEAGGTSTEPGCEGEEIVVGGKYMEPRDAIRIGERV
jgi:hypothetical protein